MVMLHDVSVPTSSPALSLNESVHAPLPTDINPLNEVTFCGNAVGGLRALASGAKVPENGAAPVASDAALATDVKVVPERLSPLPPCWLIRLSTLPFGALRFMITSPIQVCVTFTVTLIP